MLGLTPHQLGMVALEEVIEDSEVAEHEGIDREVEEEAEDELGVRGPITVGQ